MTAGNQIQVDSWKKSKRECGKDEDKLFRRIWKTKVQNTLGKARSRHNLNGTIVFIAMEKRKYKEGLSPMARRIAGRVCQVLAERGFKFNFEHDHSDDVAYVSVHILTLKRVGLQRAA